MKAWKRGDYPVVMTVVSTERRLSQISDVPARLYLHADRCAYSARTRCQLARQAAKLAGVSGYLLTWNDYWKCYYLRGLTGFHISARVVALVFTDEMLDAVELMIMSLRSLFGRDESAEIERVARLAA